MAPKKLALGEFARRGIEACASGPVEAAVEAALRYYRQTRPRQPSSAFLAELEAEPPDAESAERLELTHAVLVYLADLDRAGAEVL
ncbi:MAG TPA: hypothetical protein VH703_02495 [Solirubrobacterales bacterium]|jgi:hypothetical protein